MYPERQTESENQGHGFMRVFFFRKSPRRGPIIAVIADISDSRRVARVNVYLTFTLTRSNNFSHVKVIYSFSR